MQLESTLEGRRRQSASDDWLMVGTRRVRLFCVRNLRARRYVLRLKADGVARVTVPRGGSVTEAKRFAERQSAWLEKQLLRQASAPARSSEWPPGTEIYFRGQRVRLELSGPGEIRFGSETLLVSGTLTDLRPAVERHLRRLAACRRWCRLTEVKRVVRNAAKQPLSDI